MENSPGQVVVFAGTPEDVKRLIIVGRMTSLIQDEQLRALVYAFKELNKASQTGTLVIDADTARLLEESERKLADRFEFDLVKLGAIMQQPEPVEKKKLPFYHHKRRF